MFQPKMCPAKPTVAQRGEAELMNVNQRLTALQPPAMLSECDESGVEGPPVGGGLGSVEGLMLVTLRWWWLKWWCKPQKKNWEWFRVDEK